MILNRVVGNDYFHFLHNVRKLVFDLTSKYSRTFNQMMLFIK